MATKKEKNPVRIITKKRIGDFKCRITVTVSQDEGGQYYAMEKTGQSWLIKEDQLGEFKEYKPI